MRATQDWFSQTAKVALERSLLARCPPEKLTLLLSEAIRFDIPAGTVIYRDGARPQFALVVSGLLRIYISAPDGRQITLRYARSGDVLGTVAVVTGAVPVSVQALSDVVLQVLNIQTLQDVAREDARVAWLIAEDVTQVLFHMERVLAGSAFGTVRQRLIRHLLDLASEAASVGQEPSLVARVTQQQLADAIGSVREVVARALRELRAEGLVETVPDGIRLCDPEALLAETGFEDWL
jgi:CRP/FNR family cyclic AMP-dependent transcriptional regulator